MKATSYGYEHREGSLPSWREKEHRLMGGDYPSLTISDDDERVFVMVEERDARIGDSGGLEVTLAGYYGEDQEALQLVTAEVVKREGDKTEIKLSFWGGRVKPITVIFDPHRQRSQVDPEIGPEDAGPRIYQGYQLVETGE